MKDRTEILGEGELKCEHLTKPSSKILKSAALKLAILSSLQGKVSWKAKIKLYDNLREIHSLYICISNQKEKQTLYLKFYRWVDNSVHNSSHFYFYHDGILYLKEVPCIHTAVHVNNKETFSTYHSFFELHTFISLYHAIIGLLRWRSHGFTASKSQNYESHKQSGLIARSPVSYHPRRWAEKT